jgi:Zn-dependent protease
MKWSWRLGRIAGIDIEIHATFAFLLAWIALLEYRRTQTVAGVVTGIVFILAVFASVVLHEYGHALTARRYGVRTRSITILPIGGVASLERMPSQPKQELAIAIAGPIVTVTLVVVLWILLRALGTPLVLTEANFEDAPFLVRLMWVNVVLAVFNLLPAFPMDGGRVLRAALAMRFDYVQATRIAAVGGRAFALLFGFYGLSAGNPFLVFIAIFVWIGAQGESWSVQLQSALRGLPVERVMIRDLRTLQPDDSLARAVDHLLAGFQQDFPVLDGAGVVGVLTRTDLVKALAQHGASAPVSVAMRSDFLVAHPGEPLEEAFARLQGSKCHTMPVVQDGALCGVLTLDNVGEFFMVHGASRSRQ